MIVPDANLLIYAYDSRSPHHDVARKWWEACLCSTAPVGIPWVVVLAFVRLMTHPTINENPMDVNQAREAVESWLDVEVVSLLSPTRRTTKNFFDLLVGAGSGGNLSTDAMIAALAIEHGGIVYSNDRDFARFTELRWRNPLAD